MRRVRALLLGLILAVIAAPAWSAPRKVVIDDEGFALMHLMLLGSKDVDVIGITTVSGNAWAKHATAMVLRGLEIAHREDVPVAKGATYPLLNSEALTERWEALYGKLTWKGAWMREWVEPTVQSAPPYLSAEADITLPNGNPKLEATSEIAANFLIRLVHEHPGEITIVACGPLTNLALAQRLDPEFASLVGELVYMGGSLNPQQVLSDVSAAQFAREFVNSPRREFNARFDPEAASIISRSPWRKLTVIPADPSTSTQRSKALLDRMAAVAAPDAAQFIAGLEPGFPMWDEIAAGYVLDPAMVTKADAVYIDYNTMFGPSYGDTLSWHEHYQPGLGEQKANVVLAIDPARLEALMVRTMREAKERLTPAR
ncbi:nucleoside hydrolase [Novosphingobium aquimarinum]|uniref:nucleoside hydrolase n=1 Tax=Novosphingobium aquimarinum TaxID=2682494 RepID=UPI0012EB2286|nr:nucleoside hydrolase [Novosphingobium aquimarinum]